MTGNTFKREYEAKVKIAAKLIERLEKAN